MHQLYTWDLFCSYWPAVYQVLLDVPRRQGFICIWLDVLLALFSEHICVCPNSTISNVGASVCSNVSASFFYASALSAADAGAHV